MSEVVPPHLINVLHHFAGSCLHW